MAEVVVFGGTTEGRRLAELLQERSIPALVCVVTAYGESLLSPGGSLRVHGGALPVEAMTALLAKERPRWVVDATHPYASHVHGSIRAAAEAAGVSLLRVRRDPAREEDLTEFDSLEAMIFWLNTRPGVIFSALGVKAAQSLARVSGASERLWLRVLPTAESVELCLQAGFPARHLICMQGPFSEELNAALFRETGAAILLTKESGRAGGFWEKLAAARSLGMTTAVLSRPPEGEGLSLLEIEEKIRDGML